MSTLNLAAHADYACFLGIHEVALGSLALQWREEDDADFSLLVDRVRGDLGVLGCPRIDVIRRVPRAASPAQWGISYVIRGSRLGGALLRRRVPDEYPTSYLDSTLRLPWPAFLQQLEDQSQSIGLASHADIVRGAQCAFAEFAAAAERASLLR